MANTLNETEQRLGWAWFVFQYLLLNTLITLATRALCGPLGLAELNFVFYGLSFLAVSLLCFSFWKRSILFFGRHWQSCLRIIAVGTVCCWVWDAGMSLILPDWMPEFVNRNNEQIASMFVSRPVLMLIAVTVFSPVTEECFFRELVFAQMYPRSRWAAFSLSACLFSAVHVAGYLGSTPVWILAVCFVQYLPFGFILAWCRSRSGCILAPIAVHVLINLRSAVVVLSSR